MRPTDLLIVGLILLVAAVIFFLARDKAEAGVLTAEIYYDNSLVATLPLETDEERDFSLPCCPEVSFRLYPEGAIAFLESTCRDKICLRMGKLALAGDWAACLPNKMLVRIRSSEGAGKEIDLIN